MWQSYFLSYPFLSSILCLISQSHGVQCAYSEGRLYILKKQFLWVCGPIHDLPFSLVIPGQGSQMSYCLPHLLYKKLVIMHNWSNGEGVLWRIGWEKALWFWEDFTFPTTWPSGILPLGRRGTPSLSFTCLLKRSALGGLRSLYVLEKGWVVHPHTGGGGETSNSCPTRKIPLSLQGKAFINRSLLSNSIHPGYPFLPPFL